MECVLTWHDPDDPDQGCNHGFEEFGSKQKMLEWLNSLVDAKPHIEARAFLVYEELSIVPEEVAVQYKVE